EKKPFGISLDAVLPEQRLQGYKSLNLNNAYLDPTFVREVLCYHVFRRYMPACKANFVVLRINGQNWGVYVNVQQINKDMLRDWFVDEDGARFEADALLPGAVLNGSSLTWLGSSPSAYYNNYELKTPQLANPWDPLVQACGALNNGPLGTLNAVLQPELAVDSALWMLAGQIVFVNPDSYVVTGHNYYLYHDVFHDRLQTLPWGVNLPLGASFLAGSTVTQRTTWNLFTGSTNAGRPLMSRLWAVPQLRERYLAHVRTMVDEWFSWAVLQPRIAAYQSLIAAEVAADTKKLYSTAAFTSNVTQNFTTGTNTVAGLQVLVNGRRPYLLGHAEVARPAPTVTNVAHQPQSPPLGATVWVTAAVAGPAAPVGAVTLYSRAVGPFQESPMFDDGQHQDGAPNDGVFGAALPVYGPGSLVHYYVGAASAAASGGAMTFGPRTAEFAPLAVQLPYLPGSGPVRINEFLALNNSVIQDPFGEWDDWVELCNQSPLPVDVSGMCLTDDPQNPTKFQLPAGTIVPQLGTLLVWCDEDGNQGPLHANFKLSGNGESIALFAADGVTLHDAFTFGPQATDVATGRLFDGGAPWVTFPVPTPDAGNELPGCGARAYSAQSYASHTMVLAVAGSPRVGTTFSLAAQGHRPLAPGVLALSLAPTYVAIPWLSLAILVTTDPPAFLQPVGFDGSGAFALPITLPADPALAGFRAYAQAVALGAWPEASNGLEVVLCP
ncbi:MAG: hypothetical protein FJ265_21250, partial [Planctomycetes bacterium]|nr:hypothetical protein [Planctomycetota bacterium]